MQWQPWQAAMRFPAPPSRERILPINPFCLLWMPSPSLFVVFVPVAAFVPFVLFVVVAIPVAIVFACDYSCSRPSRGNGEVGGAGVAAMHDAASLLLALAIVIVARVFALALWMPSLLLFDDDTAGAGVFNGAGAGAGIVAIVCMFVEDTAHGTD